MGVMAVACYRPKPGKDDALLALTKTHLPILRNEGLVDAAPSICGRAKDGTIVEVFVWKSQAAIDAAHQNAAVAALWAEYAEISDYVPFAALSESKDLFSSLEHIKTD